jgi:hypothetical protein
MPYTVLTWKIEDRHAGTPAGQRCSRRTDQAHRCGACSPAPAADETSGPGAQRSQAASSTGFHAVSLRASPSHLSGRGMPHRHPLWSHSWSRKRPSPRRGKGLELRKLVAGDDLNLRPLGYEQADRRPSPSQPVAHTHAGLSRRRRIVSTRRTMSSSSRGVSVTITVTRARAARPGTARRRHPPPPSSWCAPNPRRRCSNRSQAWSTNRSASGSAPGW